MSLTVKQEIELIQLLEIEAAAKARESFLAFVLFCNPNYQVNWHHVYIANELERFYYSGEINRMMIFVPPQHGKSELASRYFPAWVLGKNKHLKVCEASYTIDLSRGFSRDVQRIIRSDEYQKVFPETRLKQKADTDKWIPITPKHKESDQLIETRGFYKAVGVAGGLTGNPVDIGVIDDPVKDAIEAASETYQKRVWDWYVDVFSTRLHNDSKQLLIMTRWNEADLAGKLLEKEPDKWKVVKIPAIREDLEDAHDPRSIGDALWPDRHSLQKILDLKALNERTFTALYQQRPAPADGNVIPIKKIKYYRESEKPTTMKIYISWDMTFKDSKGSDFVAGHVYGVVGANRYLLDRVHGRWDFVRTLNEFVKLYQRYSNCECILVEEKANGAAIISSLRKQIPRIIPIVPKESKLARAQASSLSIDSGNWFFPDPIQVPWVNEVIEEMRSFPNAAHDDDVDAWSQFENYVYLNIKTVTASKVKGIRI